MERVDEGTGTNKRAAGRQGKGDKQPAVMDVTKLRDDLPRLKKLKVASDEAAEDYANAITKSAEKAGVLSAVLRRAVNAYAGDDFAEEQRKVEQLHLVFEEVAKA